MPESFWLMIASIAMARLTCRDRIHSDSSQALADSTARSRGIIRDNRGLVNGVSASCGCIYPDFARIKPGATPFFLTAVSQFGIDYALARSIGVTHQRVKHATINSGPTGTSQNSEEVHSMAVMPSVQTPWLYSP